MDIMCVLHDSDEYGVVRWPLSELASAAGCPIELAQELAAKDVLKGADADAKPYHHVPYHAGKHGEPQLLAEAKGGPMWYCSRFLVDEWRRTQQGKSTRFTTERQPDPSTKVHNGPSPSGSPSRRFGERKGDGATSPSPSSNSVPNGTGADAPTSAAGKAKTQSKAGKEDPVKREIWDTGLRLLWLGDVERDTVASFLQGLIKQHGQPVVLDALRAADLAKPLDAKEYIVAACLRAVGARPQRIVGGTAAARREDLNAKLDAVLAACEPPQPQAPGGDDAVDGDVIDGDTRIIG
jgi:hypothetical protein